ncbi:PAS domain-containing protein [Chondromyces apiculatus]|uniref:Putative PAS/PAC sensor protein n=1 Tax=Chondromyces apiculatus DSM 436 TaxID=1192034 RepID=A0A017TIA6_9BACT|nr:PAS domain-containing protein [Chondromyces apiculatus]EYF08366.1 putative PAS/PAC sensor protein [Chondromyces apiculatus DSM 436]
MTPVLPSHAVQMTDPNAYGALVDACPDMLSTHQVDGSFQLASAACKSVLGWTPDQLAGRRLAELVHADDRIRFDERWRWGIAHEEHLTAVHCRLQCADGDHVWIELRLRVTRPRATSTEDRGAHRQVLCIARRVTAHVPPEFAYSQPETVEHAARHRDVLTRMMPGMIWYCEMNPDATLRPASYMSRYLERLTGFTPEQWVNTPGMWASLIDPTQRDFVLQRTREVLQGHGSMPPYRMRTMEGSYLWLQSELVVERLSDGTPVTMYGLSLDVTRYKEAEEHVEELLRRERALHDRLDGLVQSVPGVLWERWLGAPDPPRPSFVSDNLEPMTGHSTEAWCASDNGFLAMAPEPERARIAAAWSEVIARGHGVVQHGILTRAGEERWLEHHVRVMPGDDEGVRCVRGVTLDVSERVHLEEESLRLRSEVEHQARRITELSVPFIPLGGRLAILPLVGTIDPARAETLLTTLLDGIAATRTEVVVIDMTGVPTLDHHSIDVLARAARSAGLLGARVVIAGVRPEVARTMVQLGVSLDGVELKRSLSGALAAYWT